MTPFREFSTGEVFGSRNDGYKLLLIQVQMKGPGALHAYGPSFFCSYLGSKCLNDDAGRLR